MGNPRVFMDLSINGSPPKRIVIVLFADVVPKTAENFRALCTGEKGVGKTTGKPLHYKGSVFHRFWPGLGAEGGDFSNHNGTGGESIYGGLFPADRNPMGRSGPGVLMTVNKSPRATGSLFLICFKHSVFLHGNNAVFGSVIEGIGAVSELENAGSGALVKITDSGELASYNRLPSSHPDWKVGPNVDILALERFAQQLMMDKLRATRQVTCENPPPNCPDEISEFKGVAEELTNKLAATIEGLNNTVTESDKELEIKKLFQDRLIMPILESYESELKRVSEELSNKFLVTSKSRGARIRGVRIRGARIPSLRYQSKKSGSLNSEVENNTVTESDEELEIKEHRFQHDLIISNAELGESDTEKKVADRKRLNSEVVWPVIAASTGAVVLAGYFIWFTRSQ